MNNLLDLQALDLKIETLRARELEIPKQKKKFDIHRERLKAELAESEHRIKALLLEQRDCESEIEQKQIDMRRKDSQLLEVKKNEEYQALLHEIDLIKKQVGVKEERIIAIMIEIDEAKAHFEEDKNRIAAEQAEIEAECKKIDAELAAAVREREAMEAKRSPIAKEIPGHLMTRYERIRKAKKSGPAIVPLRVDSCTGCNMQVTAQVVNEILGGEIIHACKHCGRLLYDENNMQAVEVTDNK